MEKFAVDLEKVLDEFEYNEEREESVAVPPIKISHLPRMGLGSLKQVTHNRPPAASYRRPQFEPINLADADFAASPPKSSEIVIDNENYKALSFSGGNPHTTLFDGRTVAGINGVSINNEVLESDCISTVKQEPNNLISTDEKPDLLEYNTDLDSSCMEIQNRLPDLTSVRLSCTINNKDLYNTSSSLDLISTTSEGYNMEDSQSLQVIPKSHELSNSESHCKDTLPVSSKDFVDGSNIEHVPKDCDGVSYVDDYTVQNSSILQSDLGNNCAETQNELNNLYESELAKPSVSTEVRQIQTKTEKELDNNYSSSNVRDDCVETENKLNNFYESERVKQGKTLETLEETITKPVNSNKQEDQIRYDGVETQKPVGFSSDLDISEDDLEDYLNELVEESLLETNGTHFNEIPTISEIKLNREKEQSIIVSETAGQICEPLAGVSSKDNSSPAPQELDSNKLSSTFEQPTSNLEDSPESSLVADCRSAGKKDSYELSKQLKQEVMVSSVNNLSISGVVVNECEVSKVKSHNSSVMNEQKPTKSATSEIEEDRISNHTKPDKSEEATEMNVTNLVKEETLILKSMPESSIILDSSFEDSSKESNDVETTSTTSAEDYSEENSLGVTEEKEENVKEDAKKVNPLHKMVETSGCSESNTNSIAAEKSINSEDNQIVLSSELKNTTPHNSVKNNTDCKNALENTSHIKAIASCSNINNLANSSTLSNLVELNSSQIGSETSSIEEATEPIEDRPTRPSSLELAKKITVDQNTVNSPQQVGGEARGQLVTELRAEDRRLGKVSPFWVPDTDTTLCMQCQIKFTVIKRRHHCRACGQVLCNKCCGLKARLEYMNFTEARVCQPCFTILEAMTAEESNPPHRRPNPNNPMEYCSTIPPLQQVAGAAHQPPPTVMVPVGVLKREGRGKSEVPKQVMFSDGIRPGGDLTELDGSTEPRMPFRRPGRLTKRVGTPPGGMLSASMRRSLDPVTHSFIPSEGEALPPVATRLQGEQALTDLESPIALDRPVVKFALNRNLFVHAKRVLLDCCVNRECWCLSSEGLACVGQDEVVFLLECLQQETLPPKDIFIVINHMYQEAAKGSTVSEMTFTPALSNNLLGSRDHGGFLFIRTSFQCTAQLVLPSPPYLVALLIHRWETPWARLFPLRLVLRLGAEFRYYPCPLVSVRNRAPLYTDIGHTIINILADFRKYSYTLPSVRSLVIHMEDRQTTINIPRNRYDQVVRALNNSNDSVLAFGANLSLAADSHLVCMQSSEDENTYHTQAINIHNKPRRVTGASFVVFNGALKTAGGLAGKSSIVEDGLMVQVPADTMAALRAALRDMRDYSVGCGPNAEETVVLRWTADDANFNIGVRSCVDGRPLDGVPSIRVHNGTDYSGGTRFIRWTEVFILQSEDGERPSEPLDISRLSESIARATCLALVPLLDLLSTAGLSTLAVRTTIHPDNVGYEAGSNGEKLPPLYMKSLDEELISVVHQAAVTSQDNPAVLELVFRIMEQG